METIKQSGKVEDVVSQTKLHGRTLLVVLETKISTIELNKLASLNFKDPTVWNDPSVKSVMLALGQCKKIISKISNETSKYIKDNNLEEMYVGDEVIFNTYGSPVVYDNEQDELNLARVIDNYNFDNKDKKMALNVGIKYTIRFYYVYEAQFVIITRPYLKQE